MTHHTTSTSDTTETGVRQLAVVTGASSGIGLELARQFVDHHFDVIVAAEDAEIAVAAAVLRAESAGTVTPVQVDLRSEDGVRELYAAITDDGRPLAAIALNAGHGQGGAFVDNDLEDELSIIDLNITSTVRLASSSCATWWPATRAGSWSPRRSPRPCPARSRRSTTRRSRSSSRSPRPSRTSSRTPASR